MKQILVLDNYDSFTYNLVHLVESVSTQSVVVKRNDALEPADLALYDRVILSPGPGLPQEAGRMMEILEACPANLPLLGVCLGMQALALQAGGELFQLSDVQHGIDTLIRVHREQDRCQLFEGLPDELRVGRYHSWMVRSETLPKEWGITSVDESGRIMSMTHTQRPWQGVQFHPESVMTPNGKHLIQNWLRTGQNHIE